MIPLRHKRVEIANQLAQAPDFIPNSEKNIANDHSRKRIILKFVLFLTVILLFLSSLFVLIIFTPLNNYVGIKMPRSYSECLNISGNKTDYEHNNYRCVWRVVADDKVQYRLCAVNGGNTRPGLVGCNINEGCTTSPSTCEIVYYKDEFFIPQSFEECLPYSIMSTNKSPITGVQLCVISIDLWGYDKNKAKSLYNACDELGRKSAVDDFQSDASGGNCTLYYYKGRQPFPEIYQSATYSASSSAFIKKVLLTIHNLNLSKYKPELLSPTPTLDISLPQAEKICQEGGGEWKNMSCDCKKTVDSAGCTQNKSQFPFFDEETLSRQPEPPVNGLNGLEELIFRDDLSNCKYLANLNNKCAPCEQDSDCGNDYKDNWYFWVRSVYGPVCDNGYCKYRRVVFRTEVNYDGKLLYGLDN